MRRKISLFIGGMEVDLQDETFILFNYTMEDMSNPTVVRNSYSQQITLKGTPQNNKVFGQIWKTDRVTQYGGSQSGVNFDPTQKTPFTIYNEMSEILESGYCKLDSMTTTSGRVEYKVSLFGGLGSFFYSLAYDSNGKKRTLADLKYTGSDATDNELNFTLNATAVKNAWKRLAGDTSVSSLWDIINFAPAYNGYPGGLFDADKALVNVEDAGLPVPDGYNASNGWVLATLPKKYTEWEVKDLRSYLQKPCIKMSAVIDAICMSYNNGGYQVVLDNTFFNSSNPYYTDTWLTLPIPNSVNINIDEGGGNLSARIGTINLPSARGGASVNTFVELGLKPKLDITDADPNATFYFMHCYWPAAGRYMVANYLTYTAEAYDSDDNLLKSASVTVSTTNGWLINGFPNIDYISSFDKNGNWNGDPVKLYIEGFGISYIVLSRTVTGMVSAGSAYVPNTAYCWRDNALYDGHDDVDYDEVFPQNQSTETYFQSERSRSNMAVTKQLLLSSDKTPADYLLSYAKMFGLVFLADKTAKRVYIYTRAVFYQNNTVDLTGRINLGAGITQQLYAFDSKWYTFAQDYAAGEYAQYYANLYDSVYGIQRVNTGYDFNANSVNLMDGMVFRGACEVLENSKYYADIDDGGVTIPSIFQDVGGTYGLADGEGKVTAFDIPAPSFKSVRTWWNYTNLTFDFMSKIQFHNADNAYIEERDTLMFFRGMKSLSDITDGIALTDDNALMMALNDNTPCWILNYQAASPSSKVTSLPMFSRYVWADADTISKSLDFGTPYEVAMPGIDFASDSDIYDQYWKAYIADRYDDDSRVMRCKVNLAGFQVSEDLFRQFYWYDGSVWALNRIINHSLSTWDDTECEFVKVQDIYNY